MRAPALLLALGLLACDRQPPEPAKSPPTSEARPPASTTANAFPLTDVTAASGVDFVHANGATGERHFPETMGPGLALFDADGDGDLDLYAVDGGRLPGAGDTVPAAPNRLYLNRGVAGEIVFDDATAASGAGDPGYGMGVAVGDVDGDGRDDLYVANVGPNALYMNRGGGRFERVEAGVEDPLWSVAAAFLDADGDRDLDLYVVNYLLYESGREAPCRAGTLRIYCSPERFAPAPDRLFRNDGPGPDGRPRFTDVTAAAGMGVAGRGMGVAVSDVDGDGDPDLYVTNDRSANFLWRNDGGRFTEVGAELGVGYGHAGQIEGGMGAVAADLDGSGRAAIFLTNFHKEPNRLYVAGPDGFFDERTYPSGVGFPSHEMVSWGIGLLDVEGDGDLDLAVANGHVYDNAAEFLRGSAFAMRDQLFVNDGGGRFRERLFPGPALSSRGVAAGDLDGDGDPDLAVAACAGPLRLWRNDAGHPERFLVVELRGRPPNVSAFGARLEGRLDGRVLRREVASGGSYASQGDRRVLLGLGDAGGVERLTVRWPGGEVEESGPLAGGQRVVWREGEGIVERAPLAGLR